MPNHLVLLQGEDGRTTGLTLEEQAEAAKISRRLGEYDATIERWLRLQREAELRVASTRTARESYLRSVTPPPYGG